MNTNLDALNTLYLDCSSGISGDMTVAALLDLGADRKGLLDALASLPLEGYEIRISRVPKSGIDACNFDVILDSEHENRDHDMAYLHGDLHPELKSGHSHVHAEMHTQAGEDGHAHGAHHEHGPEHEHDHHEHDHAHDYAHDHPHEHEHDHAHDHHEHHGHNHHEHGHDHSHEHHGRNLDDIRQILYSGALNDRALEIALRIFEVVAEAEAKVHGKSIDEVHFHEVGAVDSIIDIAAIAFCIDDLNIGRVIIPVLNEGTGMIRCQHGLLPVPVPATAAIASAYALPLHILPIEGELVTPTGAATAAALCTGHHLPESFTVEKVGIGAGKRDYKVAGILRAMLITDTSAHAGSSGPDGGVYHPGAYSADAYPADAYLPESDPGTGASSSESDPLPDGDLHDTVLKLEANLDDATGEMLGYVMDELFAAGAMDVFYTPITMKKSRPAVMLSLLCPPEKRQTMEYQIFRHTTCIGLRWCLMRRTKLEREIRPVDTPLGEATVKYCFFKGEVYCYPEHDSVCALAETSGLPYKEIYNLVKHAGVMALLQEA